MTQPPLLAHDPQARRAKPTYDEWRIAAKHLCWLCCRREVFSTNPEAGCIACR